MKRPTSKLSQFPRRVGRGHVDPRHFGVADRREAGTRRVAITLQLIINICTGRFVQLAWNLENS